MYPNCLNDLVGLVTVPGQCLEGSDISNETSLGLYVDQDTAYDRCRFQNGETYCELIKLMADVREEALRQVYVDVSAILATRVKMRSDAFYYIGQNSVGAYLSPSLIPANPSITIKTEYLPGGNIRLNKLALMISPKIESVTVDVRVYRIYGPDDSELVHTWTLEIERLSTHPRDVTAYTIPTNGDEYRIEYTYDQATMSVPDSNYHCSCGDVLKSATGFIKKNPSKSYGISLYATLFCDSGMSVCNLLKRPDYAAVLGFVVRRQIIIMLLKKLYYRQDVNRFTLLTSDDMKAVIEDYSNEYAGRLMWLDEQKDFEVDGFCLMCGPKNSSGPTKINLLTGK